MPYIGPNKRTYIRDRKTRIFPNAKNAIQPEVTTSKNGFGGYLGYAMRTGKYNHNKYPVMIDGLGGVIFSRIDVKEDSNSVWNIYESCEKVYPCLAYTKGRIYYGATFGEGMIIDFDGSDYIEYAEERRFQNRRWSDEATLERAWKYAERCAERMAEKRAEEIEEDQREQEAEREEEEKMQAKYDASTVEKARLFLAGENTIGPALTIPAGAVVTYRHEGGKTYATVTAEAYITFERQP